MATHGAKATAARRANCLSYPAVRGAFKHTAVELFADRMVPGAFYKNLLVLWFCLYF